MPDLAERDSVVVLLRTAPASSLVELAPWMEPALLLNSYLYVGVLAEKDLLVVALRMNPALLLNSYLDVGELELVVGALLSLLLSLDVEVLFLAGSEVEALFLAGREPAWSLSLLEADLDHDLVTCPVDGRIAASCNGRGTSRSDKGVSLDLRGA